MWKQLQNRRGVALTFVIMILLVTSIMVSIVALIANANIVQASAQEKGLQAYYIARSGAELAYEVLMTTTPSLIEDFKDGSISSIAADTVDFEKGSATVEVTSSGSGESQKITRRLLHRQVCFQPRQRAAHFRLALPGGQHVL